MAEQPATKVPPELLLDVTREVLAALLPNGREEGLEVLAHDEVEHRRLGTMALVRTRLGRREAGQRRAPLRSARRQALASTSWRFKASRRWRRQGDDCAAIRALRCVHRVLRALAVDGAAHGGDVEKLASGLRAVELRAAEVGAVEHGSLELCVGEVRAGADQVARDQRPTWEEEGVPESAIPERLA
jgi:hypothetical protein